MTGENHKNHSLRGCLPGSVGGLHAPINCMFSKETQALFPFIQNPFWKINCHRKVITGWVPNLSSSGRLISSQNMTSFLLNCFGAKVNPYVVFVYWQYCSSCLSMVSGPVVAEKLIKINWQSGRALSVDIKVIVLPLPGGPHKIKGLSSLSHCPRNF